MRKTMMKRQRRSVPMSLPDDVITDILLNLPVKSIHRFRSVSKSWCSLFSNPNFIKRHLNHAIQQDKSSLIVNDFMIERAYLIDFYSLASNKSQDLMDHPFISVSESKISIVGYCNGLVSYTSTSDDRFHIWNPSTNEYKTLPVSPYHHVKKLLITAVSCGLGYDCKIDDYKFLIIYSASEGDKFFSGVMIHTLGSETWNTIEKIPYKVLSNRCGVFLSGTLHWVGTRAAGKICSYNVILSFDMIHESVKDVPLPTELNENSSSLSMGLLRDHLCIFDNNKSKAQTQVWVMKEEHGDRGSWTKLFSIQTYNDGPFSYYLKPINCFNNRLMLLQKGKTDLVLYDQKEKAFTKLNYVSNEIQAISCVGSLVSLNSKTYLKQELDNPM